MILENILQLRRGDLDFYYINPDHLVSSVLHESFATNKIEDFWMNEFMNECMKEGPFSKQTAH